MKCLLLALAIFLLLAQLVSGSFYVRKCANKGGYCRRKCNTGELLINPPTGLCSRETRCCVKDRNNPIFCGGHKTKTTEGPITTPGNASEVETTMAGTMTPAKTGAGM
ncbi:unnamed protein product, partial [Pipistrellus nathusii]